MGLVPRRLAWQGLAIAAMVAVAGLWAAPLAGAATPTVTGVASGNGSSPATVTWTLTSSTPITMFVYGYNPYGTSTLSYNGSPVALANSSDPTPIPVGPGGTQLVQSDVPCGTAGLSASVDVFEAFGPDVPGSVDLSTCPVPPPPTTTTTTTTTAPQPVTQPTSGAPAQPVTQPTSTSSPPAQPTTAAATTPATTPTPQIAFTGANTETTAGIGVGLSALGAGLVLAARRRKVRPAAGGD